MCKFFSVKGLVDVVLRLWANLEDYMGWIESKAYGIGILSIILKNMRKSAKAFRPNRFANFCRKSKNC